MSDKKPLLQTLKGFRDFLPEEKKRRDFVMDSIKKTFETFGFEPLETPTLEYSSLILGKYGTEADKLVYSFKDRGNRQIALKYDQTVPTARVLAQYKDQLPKYFRRYQIQNVFRADKPQKGRYREFTQCDIDIFNTTSPIADAEIIACTYFVFKNLGFPNIILKINDRQILFNILKPYSTKTISVLSIIQTIDKLDKKPKPEVIKELINKGLPQKSANQALNNIQKAKITKNLKSIYNYSINLGVPKKNLQFSPSLARGLDYYTGMIFEVIIPEYPIGSFGGGGRYDKLISQLGGPDIPAVGIAYGFDRMVEAATKLNLIKSTKSNKNVLVTQFPGYEEKSLNTACKLRKQNINTEVYPQSEDLAKQLKYANKKNIPFVIIIGPDEANKNLVTLKNLETRQQETISIEKVIEKLK
ncbi:MAG: histidine--tRNA ligase [Patescibacteria group bacterium]|nr:histidine--tRNA ligase [Patescibacteria group bacterium]